MLLLVNLILWGGYSLQIDQQNRQWWVESERGLDSILIHFEGVRNDLHGDLSLLAASPNLKALLDEAGQDNLDRLASEWELFVAIKRRYDQVRWIDNQGMERLRINRTPQGAQRVSEAQLQDKSDRYYFKQAISLAVGQVYASPIDLNMERGEIERPFKPMLRLAVPVTDSEGYRQGLLLVNVLVGSVLENLAKHAGYSRAHLLLIDPQGYYVLGFHEGQGWGFMLKRNDKTYRFDKGFPLVWRRMVERGSGRVDESKGRFLFRSIRYGAEGFGQRYFLVMAGLKAEFERYEQAERPHWLWVSLLVSLILVVLTLTLSYYLLCCRRDEAGTSPTV
jgi:hypothetical protein